MFDVELFQNCVSFSLCCITSINLYWYYYIDSNCLSYSLPILLFHFSYDIFLTKKWDVKLHHIFCIMLISSKYLFNINESHYSIPLIAFYNTEISSYFYVIKLLKPYIDKSMYGPLFLFADMKDFLFVINDVCFFITFFKFRIYDYYNGVIMNKHVYTNIDIYASKNTTAYIFFYGGIHGMFLLNSYWFSIICKILFKKTIKSIAEYDQIILCHKFVSYTLFINALIGYLVYSLTSYDVNYDITGISLLASASYLYHDKIVKLLLKYKTFEYTSDEVVYLFLQDMGSIHLRSFLCVVSNYYYTKNEMILWYTSMFHIFCFFSTCVYVWYHKWNNEIIIYDKSEKMTKFLSVTNALTIIPTTCSILSIVYNTTDASIANNIFYSTYFCGIALVIQPFYDLSHCLFHIGLLVQTYYLAISNVQNKL